MLLYMIPLDVLNFYYSRIHGLLQLQGHQRKGLVCVSVYCLCRLLYKLLQSLHNRHKRLARQKEYQQKYEPLLQALDELQHPLDVSITDLPFHDLCLQVSQQPQHVDDILLAFQIKAVSTDVKTNAIVDLLNTATTADVTASIAIVDVTVTRDQSEAHTDAEPPPSSHSVFANWMPGFSKCCQSVHNGVDVGLLSEGDKSGSDVATSSRTLPPEDGQPLLLNNVPISLSEVIHLRSRDATAGLSAYLQINAKQDAVVVQLLRAQGAVPVMRTNVPQTAYITFGSSNPVYGTTRNPFKPDRSPGGTCSGEAVIASARASVLGVGTDVSGGLRIPAHFCGVCALKPTSDRVSRRGVTVPVEGQNAVVTCVGPMSSEVAGLVAFMKCVCVPLQHHLDPSVSMSTFNHEMYESTTPLCVGFFVDDGHTKCVPSVRRAVMEAKALLEQVGYKVVPFEPPDLLNMLVNIYLPAVLGDHFFTLICGQAGLLCEESLLPAPSPVLCQVAVLMVLHVEESSECLGVGCQMSTAWRQQFIRLMAAHQVDVLLCPVLPFAAVKLGSEESFTGCLTYSALFNLLDFPAGTVPVSAVTAGDLADLRNPETYKVDTWLERHIRLDQLGRENEPGSSSQDLPVGVQIASLPYHDEMVLRVLGDLEKNSGNLKRRILDQDNEMRIRI